LAVFARKITRGAPFEGSYSNFSQDCCRYPKQRQELKVTAGEVPFRAAIETARKQYAEWHELRATISLARLLAKQDRCNEARTMLAAIYGWFTESFDTPDLKDAKALLDELAT
jgi:predicted ATPase